MKFHNLGLDALSRLPARQTIIGAEPSRPGWSVWKVATLSALLGGVAVFMAREFVSGEWR